MGNLQGDGVLEHFAGLKLQPDHQAAFLSRGLQYMKRQPVKPLHFQVPAG